MSRQKAQIILNAATQGVNVADCNDPILTAMEEYAHYVVEQKMKQKIEELKMSGLVADYDQYGAAYKEGIDKAIEILKK